MEDQDMLMLYTADQNTYNKNIHILIGGAQTKQEKDRSAPIPDPLSDRLHPVYATILPHHQSENKHPRLNLRILHPTLVGDRLTIDQASSEMCEMKDCIFLRRIHEIRKNAEDADNELWKWIQSEMKLYWTIGREDDEDYMDDGNDGNDGDDGDDNSVLRKYSNG